MSKHPTAFLYLALFLGLFPPNLKGQVNSTTENAQQNPAAAMDSSGNYTIVWESVGTDGDDYGIYGQRYSADGSKNGSEFKVNTTTAEEQRFPDIAMGDGGDFVVTWMSMNQDGDSWGIYFQRYNSSGTTQGNETKVNSTTAGVQRFPAIAMDNSENFTITWCEIANDGTQSIKAQRFNSSGTAQGSELTVNSTAASFQGYPDIAMGRSSGNFTITWQSSGLDGSGMGVYAQRYNASGTAQSSEFIVNTTTSEHQREPRIAMDGSDNFVVIWSSYAQDGSSYGVYGQRYNSSGTAQGSEFKVNETTSGAQVSPAVAMTMEGGFAVIWSGFDSGNQSQPYISGYTSNGTLLASDTLLTSSDNFQLAPDIAVYNESTQLAISFQQGLKWGSQGDGDDFGIFGSTHSGGDILYDALTFVSSSPSAGTYSLDTSANLTFTFDNNVASASITGSNIIVRGSYSGKLSGSLSGGGGKTITFNPNSDLFSGERVTVTLKTDLTSTNSKNLIKSQSLTFSAKPKTLSAGPAGHTQNVIGKEGDAWAAYPCDLDGDGDMDLVATSSSPISGKVLWYKNDGQQSFTSTSIALGSIAPGNVEATDMDNDGDMDIVYVDGLNGNINWLQNDGSENFSAKTVSSSVSNPQDLFVVDLDCDGDVDVVVGAAGDSTVSWFENNGSQSFTEHELSTDAENVQSVYVEDMDLDGDLDILAGTFSDDKIRLLTNDGEGNFSSTTISSVADGVTDILAVDVDGDGDMDVLSASSEDDKVAWYSNNGSGTFTRNTIGSSLSDPKDVVASDFDGDGDIDVLAALEGSNSIVRFENDGSESFTSNTVADNVTGARNIHSVDMDGNGYLDIVSVSLMDSTFAWYETETAFIWQGSTDTTWATGNNWKTGSTPSQNDNILIPNSVSNYPYLSSNTNVNDLTIEEGAELTIANGVTLSVYGDVEGDTSQAVNLGDGKLSFAGSSQQTCNGKFTGNVVVNNSNDVVLQRECTFGTVEFTSGSIEIVNSDLTLTGSVSGAGTNSYFRITGNSGLKRNLGSSAETFHVGFNPYTPIMITCPGCSGSETFEVSVTDKFYENPTTSTNEVTDNVVTHTWKVVTNSAQRADVQLQWNATDEGNNLGSSVFHGFWLEGINNNWADSAGSLLAKSGSDPYTTTRTVWQMNGTYHFGVGNSSSSLPVELNDFTATWHTVGESALLTWETASEHNNDRFEIERSTDGNVWSRVGILKGMGNTLFGSYYEWTDHLPEIVKSSSSIYYRLKQIDFDGSSSLFDVKSLKLNGETTKESSLKVYPNPVAGSHITTSEFGDYRIYTSEGKLLKTVYDTDRIYVGELPKAVFFLESQTGLRARFIRN